MKGKRCSEEQIIGILKENEAGMPAQDVIRKHGIASGTFYRWKSKYGGMELSDAKRLREFELEKREVKAAVSRDAAGQDGARGCSWKKVLKPTQRRDIVAYLQSAYCLSQRKACRLAKLSRKAAAYRPVTRQDGALRKRLKELSERL